MKFQVHSFYTLGKIALSKINKGNNSKERSAEYGFLYTALFLNEIYHPMKFQVQSFYTLGEIGWTKITYTN
jgi:hypothetical protein